VWKGDTKGSILGEIVKKAIKQGVEPVKDKQNQKIMLCFEIKSAMIDEHF
jgi:hypothetical protein